VIVPIYRSEEQFNIVSEKANEIMKDLRARGIRVKFDGRDTHKPGWKFNEYELKGVPVRLSIGPRDVENNTIELARRDTLEKELIPNDEIIEKVVSLMDDIQKNLYKKALDFRTENTSEVESYDEFKKVLDGKGGFILAHWDGTVETENKIKNETKATIRCIPLEGGKDEGTKK
jgi:prolyl-tRNA synthetase